MSFLKEQNSVLIKFKKLNNDTRTPTQAYSGDACWDLYSVTDTYIPSGEQREVKTGISFETPEGWHFQIHTRSSYGKKMLRCHLGIVDSGYRGEITVWINNYGKDGHYIKKGDKVCQILFVLTPQVKLQEVSELEDSERGTNGHGSSGR